MNGSRPFTAVERETLTFLREKAAEWLRAYALHRMDHGDSVAVGKALGSAQAICESLVKAVPEKQP